MDSTTLAVADEQGYYAVNPNLFSVTTEKLRLAREHGLRIYPWTIRTPFEFSRVMNDWDVAGVITDYLP